MNCEIDRVGEVDLFRFSGVAGQTVRIQVTGQTGPGAPYFELHYGPRDTLVTYQIPAGNVARQDIRSPETGNYTIRITDSFVTRTLSYMIFLQCLEGPCSLCPEDFEDDFNSDGKPDLVWQNQVTGEIGVWFMDGINLISPSLFNPGQVPPEWKIVGNGDFNSDSKPDLVWQNQSTREIGVWFMDGINLISPSLFNPPQAPDANWKIVGINDFNRDGKPDLVWQHQTAGLIGVWFMDGINQLSSSLFNPGQVPPDWKIVGTGDFNNDCKPDLLWENQGPQVPENPDAGKIVVWFMDGIDLISPVNFNPPQVTDTNWKIPNVWTLIK